MTHPASASTDDTVEQVLDLVRASRTLPVGFIGSGFSKRYLDTPDWKGLLSHLADLTGEPLNRFLVQRTGAVQDTFPDSATSIAQTFREIWWNDENYADERRRYSHLIMNPADPIKIQAANFIDSFKLTSDENFTAELEAFRKARFQSFVTTNYDTLLEQLRPDYACYESQGEALFSPMFEIGEIYKIHGSTSSFSSIVLTREDYSDYQQRNPYLTAKMLTMFVENPVLFFGYSLGDPHVQELLAVLTDCLTEQQLETLNGRLIFIGRYAENRPESLQKAPITVKGHTFFAYEVGLKNWAPLFDGLSELPYHFAPRVLRRLRESVYQTARDTEITQKVQLVDIDDDTALEDLEIVLGVNVIEKISQTGYEGIPFNRYLEAVLQGQTQLDSAPLSDFTFKTYGHKYVPTSFFSCLARAQSDPNDYADHAKLEKWRMSQNQIKPYYSTNRITGTRIDSFEQILCSSEKPYRKDDLTFAIQNWDAADIKLLQTHLLGRVRQENPIQTNTAKLCCVFDKLVYGGEFQGNIGDLWKDLRLDLALLRSVN